MAPRIYGEKPQLIPQEIIPLLDRHLCLIGEPRKSGVFGRIQDDRVIRLYRTQERAHGRNHRHGDFPVSEKFADVLAGDLRKNGLRRHGLYDVRPTLTQRFLAVLGRLRASDPETMHGTPASCRDSGQYTSTAVEELRNFSLIRENLPLFLEEKDYDTGRRLHF